MDKETLKKANELTAKKEKLLTCVLKIDNARQFNHKSKIEVHIFDDYDGKDECVEVYEPQIILSLLKTLRSQSVKLMNQYNDEFIDL